MRIYISCLKKEEKLALIWQRTFERWNIVPQRNIKLVNFAIDMKIRSMTKISLASTVLDYILLSNMSFFLVKSEKKLKNMLRKTTE